MVAWLADVKSGSRLALTMVGTIMTVSVLVTGLLLLGAPGKRGLVLGIGIVLVVTFLLFATVRWWAKWFFAACCLITLRAVVMGALGRTISVPSIAAPSSLLKIPGSFAADSAFWFYGP